MILVVPPKNAKKVESEMKRRRERFFRIGRIEAAPAGKPRVTFSGSLNMR